MRVAFVVSEAGLVLDETIGTVEHIELSPTIARLDELDFQGVGGKIAMHALQE